MPGDESAIRSPAQSAISNAAQSAIRNLHSQICTRQFAICNGPIYADSVVSLRNRSTRWVAALVLVTGWLAPIAVPHGADDDWACVARRGQAGEPGSELSSPGTLQQPDHCLVCHAARSFRSAQPETGRVVVRLSSELFVEPSADGFRRKAADDRLPARAPPAEIEIAVVS